MYILGISAYYHDSSAVLIKDGELFCAIEEERFTRIKHDNSFPIHAIMWCLKEAGITPLDVDVISYYEKPLLKFERILDMFVQTWPRSLVSFVKNMPELLGEKLSVEDTIRKKLKYNGKIVFVPHHLSHAAAAYYSSPFVSSAILTIDGVGEYQTTGLWSAKNGKIELIKDIYFPHSLGLFYSTCAAFLGFKVNEDEYKLMGLAAYGKPLYVNKLKKMLHIKKDGSFNIDMSYFSFQESSRMWSNKMEYVLGKSRQNREKINKRHMNIAKSVQTITERAYMSILNHLYDVTREEHVCIGGGVALNALANGLISSHTPFKKSHIFGPSGDSGAALGSALYVDNVWVNPKGRVFAKEQNRSKFFSLSLGPKYSNDEIENILKKNGLVYTKLPNNRLYKYAANDLNDGKIIGWYQGRSEFGPRALGHRSILCKPSPNYMKTKVNKIKIREQFRPFAGSILQKHVHKYFIVPEKNHHSPFMNYCFKVKSEKQKEIAAIAHKDKTCRIQTVSEHDGPYYQLIVAFYKISGIPCILNTSFNLKGEPIVENPEQAVMDFIKTKLDVLYLENFQVIKQNNDK